MNTVTHKKYLALALPFTVSTITQPLLGAVDTAVVGRLGSPDYIGGVAVGTVIINTLYGLFGFLRAGTSGFSAQSLSSADPDDGYFAYFRPLAIAGILGLGFVLMQGAIFSGAMAAYTLNPEVARHAETYFSILIWGAPLILTGYVNLGWLMGRKKVKETLFLQISTNVINIVLDLVFVTLFKMDVAGVAWATLISQVYGFALGLWLISGQLNLRRLGQYRSRLFDGPAMKKMVSVNRDLMIRTFCLLAMTNMFVAKGSALGDSFLAANAVLFQLQYMIAYFFDGYANASAVFAGEAVGENNPELFRRTLSITNMHMALGSGAVVLALTLFPDPIIRCFTDISEIVTLCRQYLIWVMIFPVFISIGIVYYGFYTGATYTAPVRNSMIVSLGAFIVAYFTMVPLFHNHGLWLAFLLFSLCRSSILYAYKEKLVAAVFFSGPADSRCCRV